MINFVLFRQSRFEMKFTLLASRKILWIEYSNIKEHSAAKFKKIFSPT